MIMSIDEINKFELCKLAYGVKHKLLPVPIIAMFNEAGGKTHRYPTRQKIYQTSRNTKVMSTTKAFSVKPYQITTVYLIQ